MTTKNDIDDLFSGSKVSVDDVAPDTKNSKPGMLSGKLKRHKTALIATVALAVIAGAAYTNFHRDSENHRFNHQSPHVSAKAAIDNMDVSPETEKMMAEQRERMAQNAKKYDYRSNVFRTEQSTPPQKKSPEVASTTVNKIAPTYLKDSETLKNIEKTTDFKVPENLKNNQVSAWIVKHLSSQPDFLQNQDSFMLALTMRSEGFVNHIYNDVGYASIGAGQTVGVQNGKTVKERFSSVGVDSKTVDFLVGLSNKKLASVQLPSNYKDFQITGQQGAQVALLQIHKDFHQSVKNSVGEKAYSTLNHNQKNSLAKIAYQKGSIGSTTANAVKEYANFAQKNPNATPDTLKNEFKKVSASYTMFCNIEVNGQKVKKSDENSLRLARMTADAPEVLQKEMQGTLTPKEAKSYSVQYQQQYKVTPDQGDVMSVDKNGEVQGYDPMKEYRELGRQGKATISVEREIEKKEVKAKSGGWTNLAAKMR